MLFLTKAGQSTMTHWIDEQSYQQFKSSAILVKRVYFSSTQYLVCLLLLWLAIIGNSIVISQHYTQSIWLRQQPTCCWCSGIGLCWKESDANDETWRGMLARRVDGPQWYSSRNIPTITNMQWTLCTSCHPHHPCWTLCASLIIGLATTYAGKTAVLTICDLTMNAALAAGLTAFPAFWATDLIAFPAFWATYLIVFGPDLIALPTFWKLQLQ